MRGNRWVVVALLLAGSIVVTLGFLKTQVSPATGITWTEPTATPSDQVHVLELSTQGPADAISKDSESARSEPLGAPPSIVVPSVRIAVKVQDGSGSLIRDAQVSWEGTRGGQYSRGATVNAVEGAVTLSVPIECRQIRVVAYAPHRIPAFKIVSGLAKASKTELRDDVDAHIVLSIELNSLALSGECALWGSITVDNAAMVPDALRLVMSPRSTETSSAIPLEACSVIVDARESAYYVLGSPPERYALYASSSLTVPAIIEVDAATPRAQRRDLKLRTGSSLLVRVSADSVGTPEPGCEVHVTYQAALIENIPGLPGARSFRSEERYGATDAKGALYLRGMQPGAAITVRCNRPGKDITSSRSLLLSESEAENVVDIILGSGHEGLCKVTGTVTYCCEANDSTCEVVLAAGDPSREIAVCRVVNGTWELTTDFTGEAKLWVRCAGQRISGYAVCLLVPDKAVQRVNIPMLAVVTTIIKWTGGPVGWRLNVMQPMRLDQVSNIDRPEGSFSVVVDTSTDLLCSVEGPGGAFQWLSVKPTEAAVLLDLNASPAQEIVVEFPRSPVSAASSDSVTGFALFEDLAVESSVIFRRFRSPIKNGVGALYFKIDDGPMYYYVESACAPGLIAGVINVDHEGGPIRIGAECAWVEAGTAASWNSVRIEAIDGRDITTLVPREMRCFSVRAVTCANPGRVDTGPLHVLVPGQKATVNFLSEPD